MLLYRSANCMMDRDERTTYVASNKFFADDESGRRRKVNPKGRKFDGTVGNYPLEQATVVNGHTFPIGLYPFVFWDVPIYDKHDNLIEDNIPVDDVGSLDDSGSGGVLDEVDESDLESAFDSNDNDSSSDTSSIDSSSSSDSSSSYTPPSFDSSSSYDSSSSSSYDSSSSSSSSDSGSSGGSDGGGGGGGGD